MRCVQLGTTKGTFREIERIRPYQHHPRGRGFLEIPNFGDEKPQQQVILLLVAVLNLHTLKSGSAIIFACRCIQSTLLKSGSAIIIACSCTQSKRLKCGSAKLYSIYNSKEWNCYYYRL